MIQSLQTSVNAVIADGRIGSPVFLRCMMQARMTETDLVPAIATLTAVANSWMPSPLERIYVLGSADATQATATVQYVGGQTAILSVNRIPDPPAEGINLMLVGNKGVIYHETPVGRHRLMNEPLDLHGGKNLVALIERAMTTGKPERERYEF